LTLSDPYENKPGPWSKGSWTSKNAAYAKISGSGSQRFRCLAKIVAANLHGKTRDELAQELRIPDSSADGRVYELELGGWIEANGKQRITSNGKPADVMVVTFQAIQFILEPENRQLRHDLRSHS
jgi:hypothetical protein